MNKKLCISLIVLFLSMLCLFSLCSCDEKTPDQSENIGTIETTEVTQEITNPPHIHEVDAWVVKVESSCDTDGLWEGQCYCGETVSFVVPKGHMKVIDEGIPATCTLDGLTEGSHCEVCNKVLLKQNVIEKLGHSEVIDAKIDPTCTLTGLTEGSHCSVCNEIFVTQQVIPAPGHEVVIDEAVPSTCISLGLTEGNHCSVCNEVLVAQEVIPSKGHVVVIDNAIPSTCISTGLTEGNHCSVCNEVLVAQNVMEKLPHTIVVDKAVSPTKETAGLTEGSHCSYCNEVLVAQLIVSRLGSEGLLYEPLSKNECMVTGIGSCTDSRVVIPEVHDGMNVVKINNSAFEQAISITSLVLSDTIREIGINAFMNCTNLQSIEFGKSIETIGHAAFQYCYALESINLPNSVKFVENSAFYYDYNVTSLNLGVSVEKIGDYAFNGMTEVKELVLPNSLKEIGSSCFCNMGIEKCVIPRNVHKIGNGVFAGCTSLINIEVDSGNQCYYSINNCLIEKETKLLLGVCSTSVIPNDNSIKAIAPLTYWLSSINEMVIPEGVEIICKNAFLMSQLTKVSIPSTVITIEDEVFTYCPLNEVIVSSDNKNYSYIDGLLMETKTSRIILFIGDTLTIPSGITSIPDHQFQGMMFKKLIIPEGVISIGEGAFESCGSLESVVLPKSLKTIGADAFLGCPMLTNITIPENVEHMGPRPFLSRNEIDVSIDPNNKYYKFVGNDALVEIATGMIIFGRYEIPKDGNIVAIGYGAYSGINFTELVIPENISSIGNQAFDGCLSLTKVTIEGKNTKLDSWSFGYCTNLKDIYFKGTMSEWLNNERNVDWDYEMNNYTIHCVDGDIERPNGWIR